MSKELQEPLPTEVSLGSLASDLISLKDQVEHLVQSTPGALPKETVHEWNAVIQRLGQTVHAMEDLASTDKRRAFTSSAWKSDRVMGVAFAAGSLPGEACRSWTRASLGWVFGAGLLLGVILRRKR